MMRYIRGKGKERSKKMETNEYEDLIANSDIPKTLKDYMKRLKKENTFLRSQLDAAVNDIEDLIDRHRACRFCFHKDNNDECRLQEIYGTPCCSARWRSGAAKNLNDRFEES